MMKLIMQKRFLLDFKSNTDKPTAWLKLRFVLLLGFDFLSETLDRSTVNDLYTLNHKDDADCP